LQYIQALLELNASVDFAMPFVEDSGRTKALSAYTSAAGKEDFIALSLNSEAGNGATALHTAAEEGHAAVVRELVIHGHADINSLAIGVTALHLAVQYNRLEVVNGRFY
jgi:ankyrin repeat protein